jgi:GMP synthase (glutamine-hydrolysing)
MAQIAIINNAEPEITEFVTPIEDLIRETGSSSKCIEYADCLNIDLNDFDGVILTGSPQGDDIVEHHLPYFRWIWEYTKPVLGICAGHHVTGFLFGAKLLRSEEPEMGDFQVFKIKHDPIFNHMPETFRVKQMHNDSITLPSDFELLASSKTCFNQFMKHKQKPLYTCQFHPEYYNHKLIRNFIYLCE